MASSNKFEDDIRAKTEIRCDHCDVDIAEIFRRTLDGHGSGWLSWHSDDDTYVHTHFQILCSKCHNVFAGGAKEPLNLGDGPLDWFAGLRALPRYIGLTRDYKWSPDALEHLQETMMAVQCLPTVKTLLPEG